MLSFFNQWKIGTKLNVVIFLSFLIFVIIVGWVVYNQVTEGVEQSVADKVTSDIHVANYMLEDYDSGEWHIEGGELYKGETRISGDFEIIDEIGNNTDGLVTIFKNKQPVTTNLIIDGERSLGVEAEGETVEVVLGQGEELAGEIDILGTDMQTAYTPIHNADDEVIGMIFVGASQEEINDTVSSMMSSVAVVLLIMIALVGTTMVWMTRRMSARLQNVNEALMKAGEGDLSTTVEDQSHDEIGQLVQGFNAMKSNLQQLIQQVVETSEQVAASSQQLTASSDETTKATEQITDSIQEVATSTDEQSKKSDDVQGVVSDISSGLGHVSENIQSVHQSARDTSKKAEEGTKVINQSMQQMDTIHGKTSASAQLVQQLGEKSEKIGDIVSLITDVSDQTNLLALNAAIEAARAGEHGKGFAVVAEEVRKLAEQSSQSAQQINDVIQDIQTDIEKSVKSIEEGQVSVQEGIQGAQQAETTFKDIVSSVSNVTAQVEEVTSATEQMTESANTMVSTVEDMTEAVKNTSSHTQNVAASAEEQNASMEEVAASASTLSDMAEDLQQAVRNFKL
ncbi:methyl-accepting chemotaxis protein [Texcoconibacillus texcoconensis]|uniref:Methyl-accepting chemotaxis protein n=1 Tax=Texcoconibacillus texcoconensis TaxID=1095777 RepID=A0A840QPR0_9BACI|nr:methyl-accepting chemotaxis protein [Texcoconibacillus texcoconensis]MBB5173402.1 methyl-accepting chemotaxis protein [Texcoconibacillus texcoconensis]